MKTPRELLIARHGADAPALDALRRRALPEPRLGAVAFLVLVFFPQRKVWGALALVWVAILVVAAGNSRDPKSTTSPHDLMVEWTINQNKLHDLLAETGTYR